MLADLDAFRIRDQLVVHDYRPDHWAVSRVGFVTSGHPSIYLQAPDGTVLHRQDRYEGGEQLSGAVRKAQGYDPQRDKNLNQQASLGSVPPMAGISILAGVTLAVAAAFRRQ